MSVLIKDMVMPTGCYDCPFRVDVNLGVGIAEGCNAITAMISNPAERLPDCPLVPVPPHGALMDIDEFFAACPELVDGYKRITDGLVVIPAEEGEA